MDAKEYLRQAYRLDRKIKSKLDLVLSLRELATKTSQVLNAEPVSGTKNPYPMADAVGRLVDVEREIDRDTDRLVCKKIEISRIIGKMRDAKCGELMRLRYISFDSWEDIAEKMNFTVRWVQKLHAKGLGEIEMILKEEAKRDGEMLEGD